MVAPVLLLWLLLTVLAIQHNGWGALFVSLAVGAFVALVWWIIAWQPQSSAAVCETVAADVPQIKEFIAAVKASGLADEAKKQLRLKAIRRDLPGAYADYLEAMGHRI